LHAAHHNYRVSSTVHNIHTWATVLVLQQFTFPVASPYKRRFYSIGTHWTSGESQQVTESVHCGAQIDSEIIKWLVEVGNGSYNLFLIVPTHELHHTLKH